MKKRQKTKFVYAEQPIIIKVKESELPASYSYMVHSTTSTDNLYEFKNADTEENNNRVLEDEKSKKPKS